MRKLSNRAARAGDLARSKTLWSLLKGNSSLPSAIFQIFEIKYKKMEDNMQKEVSKQINPNLEKISNALKAERIVHRVTFNPKKAKPGETLRIPVPKLDNGVVLIPGSLGLIFNFTVSSG